MRRPTESTLPSDPRPSDMKQLLDERRAIVASLKFLEVANQKYQEHLTASFIFALMYTNGPESIEWLPPPSVHGYDGMIWQESDRWSCFVLVHYRTSVGKDVPQAALWNGISPLVTKPEGVAWEKQVAFEREWRRFLDSPDRNATVRYFKGGEAVLPRKKFDEERKEIPLTVSRATAADDSVQIVTAKSTIEDVTVGAGGRQLLGSYHPSLEDLLQSRASQK
ncbi:hypothetical protein PMIN04_012899 [Paraphaeosphaeria minitans]|uniref:Uncharacterized protein n=1 Tax=Paraphaeosphaeria minitans TaxID=565426 RepID=A0A9P6KL82_9PLEO|nr:hypothetical protein PMIN01_12157 [Paraphaeosphaeria minitans]